MAGVQILVHNTVREQTGANVSIFCNFCHTFQYVGLTIQNANTRAGANQLAEREHLQGALRVKLKQRWLRFTPEAQWAVGCILNQPETVLVGQFYQRFTFFFGACCPRRILEIRDQCRKTLACVFIECCFQRFNIWAIRLQRNTDNVSAVPAQHGDSAVIGGNLGEHNIARLQKVKAQKTPQFCKRSVRG